CLCGEIFWLRLCCALQFVAGQTATNSTISRKTTSRRDECSLPEFLQRLPDLLLCVHYERAITGNGLVQRFPGNQQKADGALTRDHLQIIAVSQHDEPCVRNHGSVVFLIAGKFRLAFKDVGKCRMPSVNRLDE